MNWSDNLGFRANREDHLFSETHGIGEETLVFVHGLGGTTRYWRSGVQALEDRYRVVLVDLLGFGDSPKPWTQYSVERHVDALHQAIADLGPVTLIGHSLGALITVAYAARHPEQVKNIAVLGMPYFGSQKTAYQYMRRGPVKAGAFYTNVVLATVACVITRRVLGRVLPVLIRNVPREVAQDLVKHSWRSATSSLWEVVYRYDAAEDLDRLPERMGTLCIHGDEDVIAPIAAVRRLTANHPGWRLEELPGVDHHAFLRERERCLELIEGLVISGA
jgi:pimeloyl-ACP methyl ester carboxylesterase